MTSTLGAFPVDTGTLNVIRDSLDRAFTSTSSTEQGPQAVGAAFSIHHVLQLLSGYQPSTDPSVAAQLYSRDDLIAALIDEILRLRAHDTEETSE